MTAADFDVVVVLGARSGPALDRRTRHAAGLVTAGWAPRLLAVGGGEPCEADGIARLACEMGVPEAAVLRERRSLNTRDNAIFAAQILQAEGLKRALLVTDWPHMARALGCFRLVGVRCQAAPVPGTGARPLFWLREGCACGLYLREVPGLVRKRQRRSPQATP